jgi:hypothetical protein
MNAKDAPTLELLARIDAMIAHARVLLNASQAALDALDRGDYAALVLAEAELARIHETECQE